MVKKETLERLKKRLDEVDEVKEINKFNVADVRELVAGYEKLLGEYDESVRCFNQIENQEMDRARRKHEREMEELRYGGEVIY